MDRYEPTHYPLDPSSVTELNTILDSCDLLSVVGEASSRLVIVTLAVDVLPDGWQPQVAYPLVMALCPAGRIAASLCVHDQHSDPDSSAPHIVRQVQLADLDEIIGTFSNHWIDDWDIVDPPPEHRFKWRNDLSMDACWGGEQDHFVELWQDDGPYQLLDIGVWFSQLYLFDAELRHVSRPTLAKWRQRYKTEMTRRSSPSVGWVTTSPQPLRLRTADVLKQLEKARGGPTEPQ